MVLGLLVHGPPLACVSTSRICPNNVSFKQSLECSEIKRNVLFPCIGIGGRIARMVGTLFSHVVRGCKGLPGWFGALFHVYPFGRGGGSKAIWAMPI